MPAQNALNSVCHNIAHHAVSGLSYVHPHLRRACKVEGLDSIEIDLGVDEPCPERFRNIEPLKLSLQALRRRFGEMLEAEGFKFADIKQVKLLFEFTDQFPDDYCSNCHAYLISQSGKSFQHAVNYLGQTITPLVH